MALRLNLINACDPNRNTTLLVTYNGGSKPITGFFHSQGLQLLQTGMLVHDKGVGGDHRNIYADFHGHSFMGTDMFTIQHSQRRRLKLFDTRVVSNFNNAVNLHFTQNNIHTKIEAIQEIPPDTDTLILRRKLDTIDDKVGRAIRNTENNCRKLRDGAITFSAGYKAVDIPRRFWLLLLRKKHSRRVSSTTLRLLVKKLDIQHMMSIDFEEARYQQSQSRISYALFIHNGKSERDTLNENLAKSRAQTENTTITRVLRRIIK